MTDRKQRKGWAMLAVAALLLAACSGAPGGKPGTRGQATIGEYNVKWSQGPKTDLPVPAGMTPLMFSFTKTDTAANTGVTEADWQREAARLGTDVETARYALGKQAYKTAQGTLASCTIIAIRQGLCGEQMRLSLDQRQQMAEAALTAAGTQCTWARFDPAYHQGMVNWTGAQEYLLVALARC